LRARRSRARSFWRAEIFCCRAVSIAPCIDQLVKPLGRCSDRRIFRRSRERQTQYRACDLALAGKPIAGAHVYLASRRVDFKRVAETIADAEGRSDHAIVSDAKSVAERYHREHGPCWSFDHQSVTQGTLVQLPDV
jgi:hypothetical protein